MYIMCKIQVGCSWSRLQAEIKGQFNPIALRKAKIVFNFGLSKCNRAIGLRSGSSIVDKVQGYQSRGCMFDPLLQSFQMRETKVLSSCDIVGH